MEDPLEELKQLLPQCLLADQLRIGSRLAQWLAGPRHGGPPAALSRWLEAAQASVALRRRRQADLPSLHYPPGLPITSKRAEIVAAIRQHPVVVIAGETGSGKTTQIPKMCLEAGLGVRAKIACTQPRRVAAVSISRRLADELQVTWGVEVGCKIRFSDRSSPETYIKMMTDGILLAETQGDLWLSEYEAIIIDEAHERSLNIDFLLGYLKLLLRKRDDLKVIITSATIDTQAFSEAFDHAPILEVSGRLYPVEVVYKPVNEASEEAGELTYIDAAVNAVADILTSSNEGDVLVFMPGERDIRETRDLLQTRFPGPYELVPLFGRLSLEEQQRVFSPSPRRKIVIATNIAETSLTIPGIRFVVDSGWARISRYNPRTRTKRLPIEPISQSSANQRKGRSGRVTSGVCIRLYSEADYLARPPYTQPEIQRANLAEVILRMKAFRLGDIETFPFVNPPPSQAIHGGYQLLQELNALDEQRELTPLGHDLARLPVDPAMGRMILEAEKEVALREVLIIASGLSVQDPRERPMDQAGAADAAHRRFVHPRSDFLALLNIWNTYHDTWESLKTQNQLRKFCKSHFLSYVRMREWVDIHAQLERTLEELGGFEMNDREGDYAAIHRAVLTGLWAHVGLRQERNLYRLGGNRNAMVFPGSSLFNSTPVQKKQARGKPPEPGKEPKSEQPAWIVAGEIVETSRLFARTVAGIDPEWILDLAPHLCRRSYQDPRWEPEAGRVLVTEIVMFNGLEVIRRPIGYATVDAAKATEIFIRCALVAGELNGRFSFLERNQQMRQKIEIWQTRLRHRGHLDVDEAIYEFYACRLADVSSVHDLNRLLRQHKEPEFLCFREADLLGGQTGDFDAGIFPDAIPVGDQAVAVSYAYAPGEDRDGITMKLPFALAQVIEPGLLDWAVPGLREEQITQLLDALPKDLRRQLMPLAPKGKEIAQGVSLPHWKSTEPTTRSGLHSSRPSVFLTEVSEFIRQHYGVVVPEQAWDIHKLPTYLRPRIEILGRDAQPLAAGRDLEALRQQIKKHETPADSQAWRKAVQTWERYGLKAWTLDDVPDRITVCEISGLPLYAYPGLHHEAGDISLRLFRKPEEAQRASRVGVPRLLEIVLERELGWLEKDLRVLSRFKDLYITLGPPEELHATALENIRRHLFYVPALPALTAAAFAARVEKLRQQMTGLAASFADRVGTILKLRHDILLCRKPYPTLCRDLDALVPRQFLRYVPFARLPELPRYLKALLVRAERAAVNPAKDAEKARRIRPYADVLQQKRANTTLSPEVREQLNEFYWLLEEYKVSCFAQELGTAVPVSPRKLDEMLARL